MANGFQKHEIRLESSRQEGADIKSFIFSFSSRRFDYKAGQVVNLVADPSRPELLSREFSIASSPTEDHLLFTMRMLSESPFKTYLNSLPIGSTLIAEGPYGEFTLPESAEKQIVFLAGGIGVTPFRGMVKYATDKALPHKITLLYSARTPEEIVYRKDWEKFKLGNANFQLEITITRPEESSEKWNGHVGRIDEELISKYADNPSGKIFYVCGTPDMVRAMMKLLVGMGVPPPEIKVESFSGYRSADI